MTLAFLLTKSANADAPYGAQGLAYLADESSLIVTTSGANHLRDPHHAVAAYSITVTSTLRGTPPSTTLTVLATRGEGFEPPSEAAFKNAIVFLYGPLPAQERREWNIKSDPVFALTTGQYGVIARTDLRLRMLADYLKIGANEQNTAAQISWARSAFSSKDTFLQQSAVLLAGQLLVDQPAPAATLLADAAAASHLSLAMRTQTIQMLGSAGTAESLAALERVATARKVAPALRRLAEKTFIDQYRLANRQ